eukprot:SAG31_NODE_21610_length_545_cov_1.040359_1_plen_159_part_10
MADADAEAQTKAAEKLKLGHEALESGKTQDAVDLFTEGTHLDPTNRKLVMSLKKAQGRLKAQQQREEQQANARQKLRQGDEAFEKGDLVAAIDLYSEGTEIDPSNEKLQMALKKAKGRKETQEVLQKQMSEQKAADDAITIPLQEKQAEAEAALLRGDF